MQEEWIPFLEAIHRMHSRLFMADFTAKPLLRSAVALGRVSGRGEYRERGDIIFVRYGETPDNDPNVIREGAHFYKAEIFPSEVVLAELRAWMESLAQDSPLLSFPSLPLQPGGSCQVSPVEPRDVRTQEHPHESDTRSRSGAPGRPTSMHLVEIEFRERVISGVVEATNAAESKLLSQWLHDNYPDEPQLTPKTIRNRLISLRRELEAARN